MKDKKSITEYYTIDQADLHEARYFAMLNNAVAVSGNQKLEGGNTHESLAYYYYLLNLNIPDCPLSLQLPENQQSMLNKHFKDLISINDFLERKFKNKVLYDPATISKIIKKIKKNSNETGVCYLPSGYSGNPGHFAGLKIRKLKNGNYALSVINHGEGAQYHQQLSVSGMKKKSSYQSDEYEINLESSDGREFLKKILELNFDEKRILDSKELVNAYSAFDLYGLLKLYGKVIPLTDKLKEKSITKQRSGSCSVTNVHAIARDILIDDNANFETRKRYHFILKLRSIIAAYEAYLKGQYSRAVLDWSLKEFSVRINKQYKNILTDEEVIYCSKLQNQINTRLQIDAAQELEEKCDIRSFPNVTGKALYNLEIAPRKQRRSFTKHKKLEINAHQDKILNSSIKPEEVKILLEFKTKDTQGGDLEFPFNEFYKKLNSLPHCSGEDKDPFWDRISQNDINVIIDQLYKIVQQLHTTSSSSDLEKERKFAMALIAYDIVAQLAPRFAPSFYKHFKGFKFANNYALGLDDIYSENSFYKDPIAYYTIKRISKNFEHRTNNKARIFTNAVNYNNNQHDKTIYYIFHVLLNESQRKAVSKALMHTENKSSANYTDEQLFDFLMNNLDVTDELHDIWEELANIKTLIGISATAHALGNFTKSYTQNKKNNIYYFHENRFHREIKRQSELKNAATVSHLPYSRPSNNKNYYNDWSENTIYHPIDDLEKQQNEYRQSTSKGYKYRPDVSLQPYQLYLSGSLNPDSQIWEPPDDKYSIYADLNEELRHIECSPNLQVVRTFAFASSNINTLSNNEIRNRIHDLLFQYGKLDSALTNQFDITIENMSDFLTNLYLYLYDEQATNELLYWAANLANDLRYYIEVAAKLYQFPIKQLQIPSFQDILLKRLKTTQHENEKSHLASLVVCGYRNIRLLSVKDSCILIICRMIANLGDSGSLSNEEWHNIFPELMAVIKKDKSKILSMLQTLIPEYMSIGIIKDWDFDGTILTAVGMDIYIDLYTGTLHSDNLQNLKDRTVTTIRDNKALFEQLDISNQNVNLIYSNDKPGIIKSIDGKWEFNYRVVSSKNESIEFEITTTKQIFNLEGTEIQCKLLSDKNIKINDRNLNPFPTSQTNETKYQYWQSVTDPNLIIVRDLKNKQLAYSIIDTEIALVNLETIKSYSGKALGSHFNLDESLQNISERYGGCPILIKDDKDYYLYALQNNKWRLSKLDNANQIFDALTFRHGQVSIIPMGELNSKIRQALSGGKSRTPFKGNAVQELSLDTAGNWQRNGTIILNLVKPQIQIENEWASRLSPIVGIHNVLCKASLSGDKTLCHIDSIDFTLLGLSFTLNDDNKLVFKDDPEYFLSEQKSIKEIQGLSNIIILENSKGDRKFIVPAFSLQRGEENNALNFDNIINTNELCNANQPYYYYSLKDNELIADSIESNLYLAILYRSLGDFKNAIKYLDRCKSHKNISQDIFAIAKQVFIRKNTSPHGAAFDLKVQNYLLEHQQKWSKDTEQKFQLLDIPNSWDEHIYQQLDKYKNSLSGYKTGIAIIPSYLRLTEDELLNLQNNENKFKKTHKSDQNLVITADLFSERLDRISRLPNSIVQNKWRSTFINLEQSKLDFSGLPDTLTTLRLYPNHSQEQALPFLIKNFPNLLGDATSGEITRINQMRKVLFSLLQNDSNPKPELFDLIAALVFASQPDYMGYFKDLNLSTESIRNTWKIILSVGDILSQHKEQLKNKTVNFVERRIHYDHLNTETPLSSDFTSIPVQFKIGKITHEEECKKPLSKISDIYFNKKEVPVAKRDFALDINGLPNITPLQKKLFDGYKEGHLQNRKKSKFIYSPKNDQLEDLKKTLLGIKNKDLEQVNELKLSLDQANRTPLEDTNASAIDKARAHNFLQARESGQKNIITISDLFVAFLQKNPQRLTEQNPFLTQDDITKLFTDLSDYALLQSRIAQIDESLTIIGDNTSFSQLGHEQDSYQLQMLASTLDKQRTYDIKQYPEFLIYEYATGRQLRADQVIILHKLIKLIESDVVSNFDMHHGLLQFAAGGGKTSVLIPILAQRFAQKGFLPIIFNTKELYQIGLEEIPKNLRESFNQNIEVIERELEHQWTQMELTNLVADLERWRQEGKCLLLKPVTWHSINITMKLAYFDKKYALAEAAACVLDFFKEKSVKLEDECHLISDPMQQSIKTFGRLQKIPDEQLDLLLRSYDYLMGNATNSRDIAKLAGIKSDRKRSIPPEKLKPLQSQLADIIANDEHFDSLPKDQLVLYLLQEDKTKPNWLDSLYYDYNADENLKTQRAELANLVVLARAFIQTHLPHILSLQYLKDYGASIHKGDITVAPKHEGKDVTSHFGDHTLVAALTIQFYQKRGLLPNQIEQLLDFLIKEHEYERQWNKDLNFPTEIEKFLLPLIPAKYKIESLHKIDQTLKFNLSNDTEFSKNSELINKYLIQFALQQIKIPDQRQSSTAADLQAGFKRSLLLSATPSLPEIYPAFIKKENCYLEEAFEAQVIDTLLDIQNKGYCFLKKSQTPSEFFEQFSPELLHKMTTLIDRGSLLTQFEATEIIITYLGLDKETVASNTAVFFSKQSLNLRSKNPKIEDKDIAGAGLIEELKKQGIKPEQFLLFLFLDLSKTTGTDIKRPSKDHAGLTVGKQQTVTETIQAAMRERQLLDDDAQSITWLMFQSLYRDINPKAPPDKFDAREVFYWMIKNEAEKIESKLINRAYQGIYQIFSQVAWHETRKNPEKFYDMNEGFKWALEEKQQSIPYLIYEIVSTQEDTETVLRNYLNELERQFEFKEKGIQFPQEALELIEKIISQTSKLVEDLPNPPKVQLNNEVQQEMQTEFTQQQEQEKELVQEQRIKNENDSQSEFIFEVERYNLEDDNLNSVFNKQIQSQKQRYEVVSLPNCDDIKQPNLIICPKHFAVTEYKNRSGTPLDQLKPIKMLLVKIMPDNKMEYIACTAKGADFFSAMINNQRLKKDDPAYAVITTEGKILHRSNNINREKCRKLIRSDECRKMLTYTNFLNGKVSNPVLLSQISKDYHWSKNQYDKMSKAITEIHVSKKPVSLNNQIVNKLCGWSVDKKKTEELQMPSQYKKPKEKEITSIKNTPIYTIDKLDNQLEESDLPIIYPKNALEGYIMGVIPEPIETKNTDQPLLIKTHHKIKLISNTNGIAGKDEAIQTLHDISLQIINSTRTADEQIKAIESLYEEFNEIDKFLETLYSKLQKFSGPDYLADLKRDGIYAITYFYNSFANGESLDICKQNLQLSLSAITEGTKVRYSVVTKNQFSPGLFVDFTAKRNLESIFNKASHALEQVKGKSNR